MIPMTSLANLSTALSAALPAALPAAFSGDLVLGLAQAAAGAANKAQVVDPSKLHPGWAPAWAFWILAALTVGGAITTILQRNLISAVMSLVATFFGIASLYALLSAHFLAAIQVLVYAGAIMVLFVFAIMVLNRDEVNPVPESGVLDRALGAGALVYLVWRLGEIIASPVGASVRAGRPSADYGTVGKIGDYFFDQFLFPFEAISILLVIAVIGVLVAELSINELDDIVTGGRRWRHEGFGATGEAYLVGPDFLVRSNGRNFFESRDVYFSELKAGGASDEDIASIRRYGTPILHQHADTPATRAAIGGVEGVGEIIGYRGIPTLASWGPVKIGGVNWGLIVKIDSAEAFAPIYVRLAYTPA